MQAYICTVCGYIYDAQSADKDLEGKLISFENLDPDWQCPVCGIRLDLFNPIESDRVPDVATPDGRKK